MPDADPSLPKVPGVTPLVLGRALSGLAVQMQAVALGWQLYAITGRAFSLGLLGLAQFLPVLCLVFVAGHVVDRGDRRRIAALCQLVDAAAAAVLYLLSVRHALTPPLIYGLVLILGISRAFERPSLQAILPGLVPPAMFPRAAALLSSVVQTASIIGPSIGGLLYGVSPQAAYATCAAAFLGAALATSRVPPRAPVPREKPTLASFFGGLTFIAGRPDILGAISLDLFAVLLGGATALLPIYARDILRAGPFGLGLLRAAPAMGAVCVSLVLSRHALRRHLGPVMFGAVAVFGVGTILFGLSRSVPLSVAALALLGGADVVSVVIRSTLVQTRTPDDMRGRVAAVNLLFIGTSNELGEFESGTLAALVGAVPAVVIGGLGTLAVAAIWMALFPGLRKLDRLDAGPNAA